jgi:pimeloyl-ACP methyl ester carboxylesterase
LRGPAGNGVTVTYTVARDDACLSVRDWGGGGAPMVLVHGLGGNQREWDDVAAELAGQFRIVTFDQRGHGESSRSADYSWATRVGDLAALLENMGLHDVTLVGHSLGAGVALEVANRIDDCRALALIDGALPVELPVPDGKETYRPLHNFVVSARRAALHRVLRRAPMSYAALSEIGDDYRTRFSEFDLALRALTCPVEFLLGIRVEPGRTGPAFQAVREEAAARALQTNPRVRVQWVDARHSMIRTHPRQVAAALLLLDAAAP